MKQDLSSSRFYAILDAGYVPDEQWETVCRRLIAGGADLIQLRAKNLSPAERRQRLERILPLFADSSIPLVINDDLDLALSYPGLGLHVGQDDLPVEEARAALGPERILGLSTHSPAQAAGALERAALLDYFAVGPVFATPTKPTYEPVGLELVSHVAGLRPTLPWFCIGGIKQHRLDAVREAGGERVVVVSEVLQADDPAEIIRWYQSQLSAARC